MPEVLGVLAGAAGLVDDVAEHDDGVGPGEGDLVDDALLAGLAAGHVAEKGDADGLAGGGAGAGDGLADDGWAEADGVGEGAVGRKVGEGGGVAEVGLPGLGEDEGVAGDGGLAGRAAGGLVGDGEVARLSLAVTAKLDCEYRGTRTASPSVGSTELL